MPFSVMSYVESIQMSVCFFRRYEFVSSVSSGILPLACTSQVFSCVKQEYLASSRFLGVGTFICLAQLIIIDHIEKLSTFSGQIHFHS
jgi:hypothetical protein